MPLLTYRSVVRLFTKSHFQLPGITAFLLGISLPVSNAMMNTALGLVIICLLQRRDFRFTVPLLRQPLIWLPALMFALLALSLLTHSHDYGPVMTRKYMKLLYVLPLALFFLTDKQRVVLFILGFLLANGVVLAVSLACGAGHMTLWGLNPDNPVVFRQHITQNVFMSFAVLLWLSRAFTQPGLRCAAYGIAAALGTLNILFMVQGRTGYVSLLAGTGIWLLLTLSRRQRTVVFVCGLLACLVFVLIPYKAAERLTLGFQEVSRCVSAPAGYEYHACDNSMGQRTAFARESWQLIKQAPLLGNGTGSFWYGDQKTGYSVHNPHNEYLLETVQTGLAGLVLFLGWMACYFRAARYQTPACRTLFIALLGSYLACHLFNSFLLDSSEGHLFVILAGILAAGVVKHHLPLTDGAG